MSFSYVETCCIITLSPCKLCLLLTVSIPLFAYHKGMSHVKSIRKGWPGIEHCTSCKEIFNDLEVMFFPLDSAVLKLPVAWNHCSKRGTSNLLLN